MRERLIELICKFKRVCNQSCSSLDKSCARCTKEQLADHILSDGWIRPPCKVGDTVYSYCEEFERVFAYRVEYIVISDDAMQYEAYCSGGLELIDVIVFTSKDIGKTVFITKEEAENALKGGNDVKCIDCEYLMFSDCYGECSKAYKGIVSPNDSCGKGVLKKARERE